MGPDDAALRNGEPTLTIQSLSPDAEALAGCPQCFGTQACHHSPADLSKYSKTGWADVEDIVPLVLLLVSDGWWTTGQTILADGGYTTKC